MVPLWVSCVAFVVSPVKTCYGGSGGWVLHGIDAAEGSKVVGEFHASHDAPDFARDMRIATGVPQALLALSKYDKVRAVMNAHNFGTRLEVTSIATPADEVEAARVLFELIEEIDVLGVDVLELQRRQPRWLLIYNYYRGGRV